MLGVTGMTVDGDRARDTGRDRARRGRPGGRERPLAPRSPATGDPARIAAVLAPFRAELGLTPERPAPRPAATPLALLETARREPARRS